MARLLAGLLLAALVAAAPVAAQAPVEVTFYYPVAVGGPVTKIIDGLAADFEKDNPGIRVKPIGAKKLREMLLKRGFDPNSNEFSQGIVAMREE